MTTKSEYTDLDALLGLSLSDVQVVDFFLSVLLAPMTQGFLWQHPLYKPCLCSVKNREDNLSLNSSLSSVDICQVLLC